MEHLFSIKAIEKVGAKGHATSHYYVNPVGDTFEDLDKAPDEAIFNKIISDIEKMEGIPRGSYSIILNDNLINRRRAIGTKENSLKRTAPHEIMKD